MTSPRRSLIDTAALFYNVEVTGHERKNLPNIGTIIEATSLKPYQKTMAIALERAFAILSVFDGKPELRYFARISLSARERLYADIQDRSHADNVFRPIYHKYNAGDIVRYSGFDRQYTILGLLSYRNEWVYIMKNSDTSFWCLVWESKLTLT